MQANLSGHYDPCCRAGLYKQLATLKGLMEEYREKPEANQTLRAPIIQNLAQTGLDQDCPFRPSSVESTSEPELLAPESAEGVSEDDFSEYVSRIYQYLQVGFCCQDAWHFHSLSTRTLALAFRV